MRALAEWLMRENEAARRRDGDHAFLRLNKRPFRFQATRDPLNSVDLSLLHAFEFLENRAGMLEALVSLVQPFGQRRDRARRVAEMTLKRHWKTPSAPTSPIAAHSWSMSPLMSTRATTSNGCSARPGSAAGS